MDKIKKNRPWELIDPIDTPFRHRKKSLKLYYSKNENIKIWGKLTSTRPRIMPAPIVPRPAIKNGIDTCNVVFHHSSCLSEWTCTRDGFRSKPFPPASGPPPPPPSPPFGSSDDTMDVVVIELNEPCDEGGKSAPNLSTFSLSANRSGFCYIWYWIWKIKDTESRD